MSGVPSISLIIAVYERPDFLEKVFASLASQTFRDFEIVVADDGSGPAVADVIERHQGEYAHPVRHIWHEDQGFRKTIVVNKAVTTAAADYLVFIDGDCILHRHFLARHFKRRKKKRVLCGRRVMFDRALTERLKLSDVHSRAVERIPFWWRHAGKIDRWRGIYLPFLFVPRNMFRRHYEILGSNFSVHKEDFYRVNGYDERIIGRGLEDNDLYTRFVNSGMAMKTVAEEALQYHCFHTSDPMPHSSDFIEQAKSSAEKRTPHGIIKD
jgi:glycosyltransferase involved in cell wall biosynthesis